MTKKRRRHSAQFKFKVALEAAKEDKTINEIASQHDVHPNLVSQWKKQLLEEGAAVFNSTAARQQRDQAAHLCYDDDRNPGRVSAPPDPASPSPIEGFFIL